MATKSILNTVRVRNKKSAENLLSALENAEKKAAKTVRYSKSYQEVKGSDIKKLFQKGQ